ncbi:hypothetical protein [Bradyrhizobium sp. CCBAU 65884]|uniref:hypothetical protein n=1 Tax=Bradyrhizobium sp. CCBAU 65884 TaxID=722477 RepID=UPI002304D755|nr:hypothetical protein [Bradyrhizobium sp. CCBAU 65884]
MGLTGVEQQGGRELLRAAWNKIGQSAPCLMSYVTAFSTTETLPQLRFSCSRLVIIRTSAMLDEQGPGETILREAHLATYFQLALLCFGRKEIRSPTVEPVQIGNLRI